MATPPPCIPSHPPSLLAFVKPDTLLPGFAIPTIRSSSSSSSSSSSPSLYAALKVLILVNGFTKRLRSQNKRKSRKVRSRKDKSCRDFLEQQAYAEIDRYLGRQSKKHTKHSKRSHLETTVPDQLGQKDISGTLDSIEQSLQVSELRLSVVAASNEAFLLRDSFHIKPLSIRELEQLIVAVKDLLATLCRTSPPPPSAFASSTGEVIENPALEATYRANLLHLLLCLQDQLLCQLISQLVGLLRAHIIECQRSRTRYCSDWFFEYPDARHPLTTTWPWSIKASLAVIWGVCWMFIIDGKNYYLDFEGNLVNSSGIIAIYFKDVSKFVAEQDLRKLRSIQDVIEEDSPLGYRRDLAPSATPRYPPQADLQETMAQPRRPPQAATSPSPVDNSRPHDQAASAHGLNAFFPNTTLGAAPGYCNYAYADWSPQAQNFQGHPETGFGQNTYNAYAPEQAGRTWQTVDRAVQTYQQASPGAQRLGVAGVSTIVLPQSKAASRVTRPSLDTRFLIPTQTLYSNSTSTSASSIKAPEEFPLAASHNNQHLNRRYYYNQPSMAEVPQSLHADGGLGISPIHGLPEHGQQTSRGPSPLPDNAQVRKRSYSDMSQPLPIQQVVPSPQQSGYGTSPVGEEDVGHRVQRTFKRENAPINPDNKYYCNVSPTCNQLLFDRKCEWSKHMDKHDRPYTCQEKECAKLLGFTYSGGLLRHEREVHGKHGGPKEQLRCTQPGCKRQNGKGFTRKENLNEHLRRVHSINVTSDTEVNLKQIATDAAPGTDNSQAPHPFSESAEMGDFTSLIPDSGLKRRRLDENNPRSISEDVESELERLRAENQDKDAQIRRLQEADAEKEERLQKLEAMFNNHQVPPRTNQPE